MLSKTILALILAACSNVEHSHSPDAAYNEMLARVAETLPTPTEQPDEYEPVEPEVKPTDSHWCCQSVDPKTQSGEGCNAFSGAIELINACANYLYCEGNVTKQDGKVTCTS